MSQTMQRDAVLSPDGRYRYWLARTWDDGPRVCWVMLNPSTADASIDDPTIRRCIRFSRDWGYAGLVVVNLFAWRSTDPRELRTASDPVGPQNWAWIRSSMEKSERTVAAWGAGVEPVAHLRDQVENGDEQVWCLGTTKDGHPRHPLYVRADTQLQEYPS